MNMNWAREWKNLLLILAGFLLLYFLPVEDLQAWPRLENACWEALHLTRWYAREHVILCLLPAFFIAGAIAVFISQAAVLKYLGADANRVLAYGVAAVSGTLLAVCSCTVLPLFAGIYRMGAGLGPACAFLYAGPAINVLAIILTARVLGPNLGLARALGAIVFSVVIGLLMHLIFRHEERERLAAAVLPEDEPTRPLWQNGLFFLAMVTILVFANWAKPGAGDGFWQAVYAYRWALTALGAAGLAVILVAWIRLPWPGVAGVVLATLCVALLWPQQPVAAFSVGLLGLAIVTARAPGEGQAWFEQTWTFTKQILPLLVGGVLLAGFLLGRPGHEGLVPSEWISAAVGGQSLGANFMAALAGALMYFATLTEVPIVEGLRGAGMGDGPALALLLAGPALSLPNMLVIHGILGFKKTAVFVGLVVILATLTGWCYGLFLT